MSGNRRWLGWLAIGLGSLVLLFALAGRGFAGQVAAGLGGSTRQQAYAQQRAEAPSGGVAPGANGQPADGRAGGGRSRGPAAAQAAPQAADRSGGAGLGHGGWFGFPFRLFGAATRLLPLALLVGLGVWLIRRRQSVAAASVAPAAPAQAPEQPSPTGEFYREESDADEPGGQA